MVHSYVHALRRQQCRYCRRFRQHWVFCCGRPSGAGERRGNPYMYWTTTSPTQLVFVQRPVFWLWLAHTHQPQVTGALWRVVEHRSIHPSSQRGWCAAVGGLLLEHEQCSPGNLAQPTLRAIRRDFDTLFYEIDRATPPTSYLSCASPDCRQRLPGGGVPTAPAARGPHAAPFRHRGRTVRPVRRSDPPVPRL